jgi:hypothetical protein
VANTLEIKNEILKIKMQNDKSKIKKAGERNAVSIFIFTF